MRCSLTESYLVRTVVVVVMPPQETDAHLADGGAGVFREGGVGGLGLLVVVGGGPVAGVLVHIAAAAGGSPEVAHDHVSLAGIAVVQADRLAGGVEGAAAHVVRIAEAGELADSS